MVLERLRKDLDAMCDETLAGVRAQRPGLVRRLPPELLTTAIRATHERAIVLLSGASETPHARAQIVGFARRAAHLGIGPDDVMAGYRVGADVANGRVRAVLLEQRADTATVLALWAWSGQFFDELADRTVEGVRREAVLEHGRRARARQALLDALLDGTADAVDTAGVGWDLPDRLVVVVARAGDLDLPDDQGVVARRDGRLVALCAADAPWLERAATPSAIGPAVEPAHAGRSWRTALGLADLADRRPDQFTGLAQLRADDYLVDLVLAGDPWAAAELPRRVLAPLSATPARSRALLEATLRAWLDHPARPQAIAAALHLHPQTVQYRLRRLRSVFGDGLDDPETRLKLALALRLAVSAPH